MRVNELKRYKDEEDVKEIGRVLAGGLLRDNIIQGEGPKKLTISAAVLYCAAIGIIAHDIWNHQVNHNRCRGELQNDVLNDIKMEVNHLGELSKEGPVETAES